MASVKYGDLEWAFTYVSASQGEHSAFVERDTGQIFWTSESGDQNDNPPEDVENLQRYLAVPHKNELELGRQQPPLFAGRRKMVQEFRSARRCGQRVPQLFLAVLWRLLQNGIRPI